MNGRASLRAAPPRQEVDLVAVKREDWRDACRQALDGGERFCGAYAAGSGSRRRWSALFARGRRTRILTTVLGEEEPSTIIDLTRAAEWDEREAHDLYGLRFRGHEPLRPLVAHPLDTPSWTTPVEGEGVYEVAVGPIHAGVIESGHFRFHVVGERILVVDLRLFHKHRGLERAAEGRELADGLAFAQRACGACAVANSVAYAQACESVLGLTPSRELRRARTLLLELERLYNHLGDIAAVCAGVGFAAGNMAFAALKERAMRLNESLAGHRFLFGSIEVGAGRLDLPSAAVDRARGRASRAARGRGAGVARDPVRRIGAGSARRGGGPRSRRRRRARRRRAGRARLRPGAGHAGRQPRALVRIGLRRGRSALRGRRRRRPAGGAGDRAGGDLRDAGRAACRAGRRRRGEPGRSRCPGGRGARRGPAGGDGLRRGARVHRVRRLRLRTASYANWPALACATAGNLLPDFPLINKSFELCYACVDR